MLQQTNAASGLVPTSGASDEECYVERNRKRTSLISSAKGAIQGSRKCRELLVSKVVVLAC